MANEFDEVPDSSASHFFVAPDPVDSGEGAVEIATIDAGEGEPESITRFLTLPTIAARVSSKCRDPLLDFTKSKILTSDEYTAAVQRLNDVKELAAREERLHTQKEASRQRKTAEKEVRAAALAEARACCLEEKEEAARLKALRVAKLAAARAAKAAEKARSTSTRRGGRAAEITQGRQVGGEGEEMIEIPIEAQEPGPHDFSFNVGNMQNPFFSYASPSAGMQHPYFLPFNQFGNHVLSMSPNPQPQTILQPPSLQHTPHIFLAQGWAPTEGGRIAREGAVDHVGVQDGIAHVQCRNMATTVRAGRLCWPAMRSVGCASRATLVHAQGPDMAGTRGLGVQLTIL